MPGSRATGSPGERWVTAEPTAWIRPEDSWPWGNGQRGGTWEGRVRHYQDHGLLDDEVADAAMLPVVDVAAADAGVFDAHDDRVGIGELRYGRSAILDLVRPDEGEGRIVVGDGGLRLCARHGGRSERGCTGRGRQAGPVGRRGPRDNGGAAGSAGRGQFDNGDAKLAMGEELAGGAVEAMADFSFSP